MDKFIPHKKHTGIETCCKRISIDFTQDIRTEIMVSFHKVSP